MHAARDSTPEPVTLDSFRARSSRFLFAGRRDTSSSSSSAGGDPGRSDALVYLEQGTARERRGDARARLMCPEPGCTAPEITTVSRSRLGARDGYRHLVSPEREHSPESVFHRQAKALVVRWARGQDGVASAQEEVRLGDGERVADVLLTSTSGDRLAVEVQYSSLAAEDWSRRNASYRDLGVAVTWVWGHVGAHSPLQYRWRGISGILARQGLPVLWINPAEEQVAWSFDLNVFDHAPTESSPPVYRFGRLDDLEVRPTGLFPPGYLTAATARRERADVMRTREREAEEARLARIEKARRRKRLAAPQAALIEGPAVQERPVPGCRRCGGRLDPSLTSGYHADPHCDRPW